MQHGRLCYITRTLVQKKSNLQSELLRRVIFSPPGFTNNNCKQASYPEKYTMHRKERNRLDFLLQLLQLRGHARSYFIERSLY